MHSPSAPYVKWARNFCFSSDNSNLCLAKTLWNLLQYLTGSLMSPFFQINTFYLDISPHDVSEFHKHYTRINMRRMVTALSRQLARKCHNHCHTALSKTFHQLWSQVRYCIFLHAHSSSSWNFIFCSCDPISYKVLRNVFDLSHSFFFPSKLPKNLLFPIWQHRSVVSLHYIYRLHHSCSSCLQSSSMQPLDVHFKLFIWNAV